MAIPPSPSPTHAAVRTRRAYFDCRFGQLHVRTAFPTTGGFDEQVTLICLHPAQSSSRLFAQFLPEIADVRSVYAPDLPGHGESDPSPSAAIAEAAQAVLDLANDLRLRQIDLLGLRSGVGAAMELASMRPELVRKLVLIGVTAAPREPLQQQSLVVRARPDETAAAAGLRSALPAARFLDLAGYTDESFERSPRTLVAPIDAFLRGQP